jgi:hypothetical protein
MLYGAPLSTIADRTVGSRPLRSKAIRGARAPVLTTGHAADARREHDERVTCVQPDRRPG